MASILVVCTGNVCRSPIAEGMLRAAFEARLGRDAPGVSSAGIMGWSGSGADPNSVLAAAELGVDISDHRARELTTRDIASAAVIVGMARDHARAVAGPEPEARPRTFTLKELVRLLEALPAATGGELAARVADADALRASGFTGKPRDEDVADPLGMAPDAFRAVARELNAWCDRLVDGLLGPEAAVATGTDGNVP